MYRRENLRQVPRLAVLAEKNCSSSESVQDESSEKFTATCKFTIDEIPKQLEQLNLAFVKVNQMDSAFPQFFTISANPGQSLISSLLQVR